MTLQTNKTILNLHNVGVFYWRRSGLFGKEHFWALKNVSLDIKYGETLGIIGRNGAGKSTLLRILAGIITPDKGHIHRSKHKVSLLALQAGFTPHLSGRENAILSGMLLGLRRSEIESKLEKILDFSELDDFFDQPIKSYSTGMRARLGFAVAFQAAPDLLLIDEVIGVGDASFRIKSTAAMKKRIKSNQTVVIVSHNTGIMSELCDRVVWIENGTTHSEGEANTILQAYHKHMKIHSRFVREIVKEKSGQYL